MWGPGRKGLCWGRVEVTAGFLLLMAWLNYTDTQGLLGWTVLACAAHELGHWCAVRLLGGRVSELRLTAVGAEMRFQGGLTYVGEILCAASGPAVNLALALWSARWRTEWAFVFSGINLTLGCFNLMPVCGLDGGRILHSLLTCAFGPHRAEQLKSVTDRALVILVLIGGGWVLWSGGNVLLLLIGAWLGTIFRKTCGEKGCQRAAE